MKLALAVLCIGAVGFMLRILIAFARDAMQSSPLTARFYLARFVPSKPRVELVVVMPEFYRRGAAIETDERMAS
jgi:hypothetical protein